VNELPVHNFVFQHCWRHCPNIYSVLEPASVSPSHRILPPALWTTLWLLLAPHRRHQSISPSFEEFTAPLRHILSIHNVTINSNNLWISAGRSPFALRNRMTERTSHLAGLWIGAAISNTPQSKKAGSTTVKRARLTGKGSRSTAVLP